MSRLTVTSWGDSRHRYRRNVMDLRVRKRRQMMRRNQVRAWTMGAWLALKVELTSLSLVWASWWATADESALLWSSVTSFSVTLFAVTWSAASLELSILSAAACLANDGKIIMSDWKSGIFTFRCECSLRFFLCVGFFCSSSLLFYFWFLYFSCLFRRFFC